MTEDINNGRSRFFIRDIEDKSWQLFSLSQNKKDGSIYLGSPEFTSFEWLTFEIKDDSLKPFKVQQDQDGHVSFHGHGQVHIKPKEGVYQLPIQGQHLLKLAESDISLRHLFTLFPKKSKHVPVSGALKRKGDQIVQSNEKFRPFVVVAFALPRTGLQISFQMSFEIDDLETFPGGMLGSHLSPLVHHDIFMIFYRTKNMNDWPKRSMLQYSDGVSVPLFFGKPNRMIDVRFRQPTFSLVDKKLEIVL